MAFSILSSKNVYAGSSQVRAIARRQPYTLCSNTSPGSRRQQYHTKRRSALVVRAEANPVRQVVSGLAWSIYKATAFFAPVEPGLSPLWTSILKLDSDGVRICMECGRNANERGPTGDTPLLYIAKQGHYKYPPNEIPQMLIDMGADLEQKSNNLTALEMSLLYGWQNIAELLLKAGADTSGVRAIAPKVTCPDCKRLIAKYNLA